MENDRSSKRDDANRLLDQLFDKMASFVKPTGLPLYRPQPTDVVISTFPKSGTTLLQNMTYQIVVATGGAPHFDPAGTNFSTIDEVAPWIDFGPQFNVMECPSSPRIFKTHANPEHFDISKSKFIYCIRNPLHWPASWLDFLFDWVSDEEVVDPDLREEIFHEYIRRRLLGYDAHSYYNRSDSLAAEGGLGPWFVHVKSWAFREENTLVLLYEDVIADLAGTAREIARFIGRELSDAGLGVVVERCDRGAMASDDRFKDQFFARLNGLRDGGMKACIADRRGFKDMRIEDSSMEAFRNMMQLAFGVNDYGEFCELIRSRKDRTEE